VLYVVLDCSCRQPFHVFEVDVLRNDTTDNGITGNVEGSDASVQKPVDGDDEFKAVRGAAASKDSVVGGNDQDQRGRRNGSSTNRTNRREDDEEDKVGCVRVDTVEVGQPDASAGEVDGRPVHIYGSSERANKVADIVRDNSSGLDTTQSDRERGSTGRTGEGCDLGGNNVTQVFDGVAANVSTKVS